MNKDFLTKQIITYMGNKRKLLAEIESEIIRIKTEENIDKIVFVDLFSGSGIVSRMAKKHSKKIITNDLEPYSKILNEVFLNNISKDFIKKINKKIDDINEQFIKNPELNGYIYKNYAPKDDKNIKIGERVFYTTRNAIWMDTVLRELRKEKNKILKNNILASLIVNASVHVNTSGVFKGFYKNSNTKKGQYGGNGKHALKRITKDMKLFIPITTKENVDVVAIQGDANKTIAKIKNSDILYLDPPYNQHPYASNYFMLNIIAKDEMPKEISKVSGIPKTWNKSIYNKKHKALKGMLDIIEKATAKNIIISYNNEGFISKEEFLNELQKFGKVTIKEIKYNTFRGGRNLRKRNIHTKEYIFTLKKHN